MNTEMIIILISGVFLIVGAIAWQKGSHLLENGKTAEAVIIVNNFRRGKYFPVVSFLNERKEWRTQELGTGYSPAKEKGAKVEVIYDPEDPANVEINSTRQLEIIPRLFVALGVAGIIVGTLEYLEVIELLETKRRRRSLHTHLQVDWIDDI